MSKRLVEIASEIVLSQLTRNPMSADEISFSLRKVYGALQEMQQSETTGIEIEVSSAMPESVEKKKELSPEDSIQNDKIMCLECGKEMRQLTARHLKSHGMDQKEYRKKYGFPMKTPLAAKSLTRARVKAARKRGLPENLSKYIESKRQAKAEQDGPAKIKIRTKEKRR